MSLLELFCDVDDFCLEFEPKWRIQLLNNEIGRRNRQGGLCLSEIMTILIHFHQSRYRDFKSYYTRYVQEHLSREFPGLVSYQRFVELMPRALVPLAVYLRRSFGRCTGISFVDSTPLAVCRNQRIRRHKVFAGLAARARPRWAGSLASSSTWWSTTAVSFSAVTSPLATWMTASRCLIWPDSCSASSSATRATSVKH